MTNNDILNLDGLNIEVLDDEVLADIAGGCTEIMCSVSCCSRDIEY